MAKQTKPTAAAENAANNEVQEAVIVNGSETTAAEFNLEVTQVPAKRGGEITSIFKPDNTAELIQAFIGSEVVQYEHTAEKCLALVKTHSKKKVKDKDDKKGYEAVKAAHNDLVKIRTSTEAKRKELGSPYAKIKAGIDDFAKVNIFKVLEAEEARLKTEREKFEKWEQEEKERLEKEAEALAVKRVAELKEAGLVFDGSLYVIGEDLSVDIVTIKKMNDTDYSFLLAKVTDIKAKITAAEKAAAEAEAERIAAVKKAEEDNAREAKELRDEKLEVRRERLEAAGFTEQPENERFYVAGAGYFYELTYDDAASQSAADFKAYLQSAADNIAQIEKAAEAAEAAALAAEAAALAAEEAKAEQQNQTPAPSPHVGNGNIKPLHVSVFNDENEKADAIDLRELHRALTALPVLEMKSVWGAAVLREFTAAFNHSLAVLNENIKDYE